MAWLSQHMATITELTLIICALCFVGGGAFALYFKDDPSKTTMPPGKAWGLIGGGVLIILVAVIFVPKWF
jgi:hypothetical protein